MVNNAKMHCYSRVAGHCSSAQRFYRSSNRSYSLIGRFRRIVILIGPLFIFFFYRSCGELLATQDNRIPQTNIQLE